MKELYFFITAQEVERYAELSGDHNPIHLDENHAKKYGFSGKVVHGMLTTAKVWSVLSNGLLTSINLPKEYELAFLSPVYVGKLVTLHIEQLASGFKVEGTCEGKMVFKGFIVV
jgi:3-hydroxybutyryl-CoA dehydratase